MATSRVKIAVCGGIVVVALGLLIGLFVRQLLTQDRICDDGDQLYYEDPITLEGTCYNEAMQGPCGENMILVLDDNNRTRGVGKCACDVEHFDRIMVYHEETQQCYFVFTQAFCEDGDWLTISQNTKGPICRKRQCELHPNASNNSEELDLGPEMVPILTDEGKRCVELGKYDKSCSRETDVVKFYKLKLHPKCSHFGISGASLSKSNNTTRAISVPNTGCPGGYFQTGFGHCQPDFEM